MGFLGRILDAGIIKTTSRREKKKDQKNSRDDGS